MHNLLNSAAQIFEGLDSEGRSLLVAMILGSIIGIVAIIASSVNKIHRRNADTALKQDMLERGLSADEIERVLAAKSPEPGCKRRLSAL
jgi:hypothetical protein